MHILTFNEYIKDPPKYSEEHIELYDIPMNELKSFKPTSNIKRITTNGIISVDPNGILYSEYQYTTLDDIVPITCEKLCLHLHYTSLNDLQIDFTELFESIRCIGVLIISMDKQCYGVFRNSLHPIVLNVNIPVDFLVYDDRYRLIRNESVDKFKSKFIIDKILNTFYLSIRQYKKVIRYNENDIHPLFGDINQVQIDDSVGIRSFNMPAKPIVLIDDVNHIDDILKEKLIVFYRSDKIL